MLQTEKKILAEQEEQDNAVKMRTNLSIPLLPEKEEDKKLAALLTYQTPDCKHCTGLTHRHLFYTIRMEYLKLHYSFLSNVYALLSINQARLRF